MLAGNDSIVSFFMTFPDLISIQSIVYGGFVSPGSRFIRVEIASKLSSGSSVVPKLSIALLKPTGM